MKPTMYGRPGVRKDPGDKITITKTYSNFQYKVTIDADGAIHVKPGDWLSKYSAALYNNFGGIHEFGRFDQNGVLRRIQNVHKIYAGETIYHIPTYRNAHPLRADEVQIVGNPMSDEETDQAVLKTMEHDFDLHGEQLHIVEEGIHLVHAADSAATIAEVAGIIAEGTAAAAAGTALALVSASLTPVLVGIAVLNANETDKRLAAKQAIGYALTAWAFDDPVPSFPSSLRTNISQFPGKETLPRVEGAWDDSASSTALSLEKDAVKKGRHKRSYQVYWMALGGGERKKLARLVMNSVAEGIENEVEKMSFWGLDPDRYPN